MSVITNFGKARGTQTAEKPSWSDAGSLQLPSALICSSDPLIPCERLNFNASLMRWWCVGGGLKKSPYLSTQMDWQAGARSEWQAISALASFKWSLYAFVAVCRRRCCCLFLMRPLSFAVHFRQSFSSPCRLSSPPSLINNNDLSKSSTPLIWLGAAWIKDRTTHLLLHQLTPLMKFFFSSLFF